MAVSSVGMFGDGITHGSPVASKYMSRRQPSIGTTSRSAPMPNSVVEEPRQLADRHAVPHRDRDTGRRTTRSRGTSIGPSTATPPIGLGRSQTMTLHAVRARGAQAVGHRVDVGVDARADVLQVDDQHVEAGQHLGRRLARLAVERVDRHARGPRRCPCGVSIMLSCTSDRKPCCGPKSAASRARGCRANGRRCGRARRRPTRDCRRCRRAARRARSTRAGARIRAVPACAIISQEFRSEPY